MTGVSQADTLEQYFDELQQFSISPLWTQYKELMPNTPAPSSIPHSWKYTDLRRLLTRAGELVDHEDAIRRSLNLLNPGKAGERAAVVGNLYAAVQLVLPGEVAPAHRHGAAAMRFIIEGDGGFTTVNGERAIMRKGDLILTPSWAWHDHGNETNEPMIWMDGLDMPLINALEASFYEGSTVVAQAIDAPDDAAMYSYAHPGLRPVWRTSDRPHSPLSKYPWANSERALRQAGEVSDGTPYDGVMFEYVDPTTGGPVMPTMSCYAQMLKPGQTTEAHRQTSSSVYHVVSGNGATVIDGQRFEWTDHDILTVPTWAAHHHENLSDDEPAFLFSYSDRPVLSALALYREEPV